jgi:hypothetical protein
MFALDLINTVAFGGVALFLGHGVRRVIPALARDDAARSSSTSSTLSSSPSV